MLYITMNVLHITEYKKHQSCLNEVEKDLQCFVLYPQMIRTAHLDTDTRKKLGQSTHDQDEKELGVVHYGFSVHQ